MGRAKPRRLRGQRPRATSATRATRSGRLSRTATPKIERLTAELAHAEAQRQELLGTVAGLRLRLEGAPAAEPVAESPEDEVMAVTPAGETVGTLDEDISLFGEEPAAETGEPTIEAASDAYDLTSVGEDTAEIDAAEAAAEGLAVREDAPWGPAAELPPDEPPTADPQTDESRPGEGQAKEQETAADLEAEAASLTLLQRGVDLLNVSSVPRKVAETTADLGLPGVHVAFDGRVVSATFLWSMGWYRYTVELESGAVRLEDRGYEERDDLRPNGAVRGDGTVQLAPAQISRAAAQRLQQPARQQPPAPEEREEPPAPAQPAPPAGGPEILSKSLLGQRTDDEPLSWEQTRARDFTWE